MPQFPDPFHVTAGYTGQPGQRTFYLQFEGSDARVTLLVEKGQVDALAKLVTRLLHRIDDEPATDWDRKAMALRDFGDPAWRVGEMSIGVDTDLGKFVIECVEFVQEDDDREPEIVRVWADHDQARRLAAHAAEQLEQGRPPCRFCQLPMAAEGHVCPAMN